MRRLIFLFLTSLLSVTQPALAVDYYYCDCQEGAAPGCSAGSDNNSGTAIDAPRQSLLNAESRFRGMSGGDVIRFCRGGSFSTNTLHTFVNSNCSAGALCAVTDYVPPLQDSSLSRPIITQTSDSVLFSLADGGASDQEQGYSFSNMDLRCTRCSPDNAANAFFFYNEINDVTLENISIDGFKIGVHLAGRNSPPNTGDGIHDRILLKNLSITNSTTQGILGGARSLTIEDSYFENNGGGTVYDHNIYISSGNNIIVRRNELFRSSLNTNGECNGVPLVVHGDVSNLLIEGNTVREEVGRATQGCWGISVDPGYASAESFTDITIRGNKLMNVGNTAIGLAACSNCIVENNTILHQQAYGVVAISAPVRERGTDDISLNQITVRNNSIYMGSSGTGIKLGGEGSQHTLVSNAIHYIGAGDFNCIDTNLAASAYLAIANNICFFPDATVASEWEKGSGTSPDPLSAWQAVSTMGQGSIIADPNFNQPASPENDFSQQNNSAVTINKGHVDLSASTDITGKPRDAQPDVGAYEFGSPNPPAAPQLYIK